MYVSSVYRYERRHAYWLLIHSRGAGVSLIYLSPRIFLSEYEEKPRVEGGGAGER